MNELARQSSGIQHLWDLADLAGVGDIAKMTGKGKGQVSMWARRRSTTGFPTVLTSTSGGPIYSRIEVQAWWAKFQTTAGYRAATMRAERRKAQSRATDPPRAESCRGNAITLQGSCNTPGQDLPGRGAHS